MLILNSINQMQDEMKTWRHDLHRIPEIGLALIFAVDRPLDMCRTVVNVTGDATVSMFVNKFVSKRKN